MRRIADLIDQAKVNAGINYSGVAERLNRSRQTVSNWRHGERVPEDEEIIALARMAGQDPDPWLAVAQAARSTGPAQARWEAIAKRLGVAAAIALCAIGVSNLLNFQEVYMAGLYLMSTAAALLAAWLIHALRRPELA